MPKSKFGARSRGKIKILTTSDEVTFVRVEVSGIERLVVMLDRLPVHHIRGYPGGWLAVTDVIAWYDAEAPCLREPGAQALRDSAAAFRALLVDIQSETAETPLQTS